MFFCVFVRFPALFCVFLRFSVFFYVFLQRTPVNFSTLSSKLNCVRQQAKQVKASRSKPKEAKASKSQLEFKFKISSTLDCAWQKQAGSSVELILNFNSSGFLWLASACFCLLWLALACFGLLRLALARFGLLFACFACRAQPSNLSSEMELMTFLFVF